jgi:hypothetical protein
MTAQLQKRLERALVRRFGASLMPIRITGNPPDRSWIVTDVETGSSIEAREIAGRIRVIAEHDAVESERRHERRIADRIDGYDRDDLGESPDY